MDFSIKNLGERTVQSVLCNRFSFNGSAFMSDTDKVLFNVIEGREPVEGTQKSDGFEVAGPREKLFFEPKKVKSAVVTCGGLCPGLNDVIRSIVMTSFYNYESENILGIRYGYNGLNPDKNYKPVELYPDLVEDIHKDGGTILASSRGGTEDIEKLVDTLQNRGINILYTIGGDGTQRGAHAISEAAIKRGYDLSVIGVPKTIDNDISYIQKSFGFETAFSKAVEAISTAHVEAKGAPNGIGLVKLMGRHSGFIAANASLAMNDVNFILIPEAKFDLYGENGFLNHLMSRILRRQHAVICVAEGAGQDIIASESEKKEYDASGNLKLQDIGLFLKEKINAYFKEKQVEVNVKYIDPSYIIRSTSATPNDSLFCQQLGQFAVHAAMAGKTDMVIGTWNNIYTHVPIPLAVSKRKLIDPNSRFWHSVITATGQPLSMVNG